MSADLDAKKVKVACIQSASVLGDIEKNIARFTPLVEKAAEQGAKILVLPEASLTGFFLFSLIFFLVSKQRKTKSTHTNSCTAPCHTTKKKGYSSQDFHTSYCIPEREKHFLDKARFRNTIDPSTIALPKDIENNHILSHFINLAIKLQVYITVPFVEKCKNPKYNEESLDPTPHSFFPCLKYNYYNAISLVSPKGYIISHYRSKN